MCGRVFCSVCEKELPTPGTGTPLAQHKCFDIEGDLEYIELAHFTCGQTDNLERNIDYWEL